MGVMWRTSQPRTCSCQGPDRSSDNKLAYSVDAWTSLGCRRSNSVLMRSPKRHRYDGPHGGVMISISGIENGFAKRWREDFDRDLEQMGTHETSVGLN